MTFILNVGVLYVMNIVFVYRVFCCQ